jgi:hypothetical protein
MYLKHIIDMLLYTILKSIVNKENIEVSSLNYNIFCTIQNIKNTYTYNIKIIRDSIHLKNFIIS